MTPIAERLSNELSAKTWQIEAAIALLDEGSTVPFIARYRKEATGALDDVQLRKLQERLTYLREMEERRKTILESLLAQGKLNPSLEQAILDADSKARLEDIYLPFKPKRRTKAQIAIEAGLLELAQSLLKNPSLDPTSQAAHFINPEKNI
ncbi:MAG: Tex-like N-terminal domain-containing protein, partial [Methylocystis sp.]